MKIAKRGKTLIAIREHEDKPVTNESSFWFALQKELNRLDGVDMVKRLMTRDGHMTGIGVYYLRDRDWKYAIMDTQAALRDVAKAYRREGSVALCVVDWDMVADAQLLAHLPKVDSEHISV